MRILTGSKVIFLLMWTIPFLISCARTPKFVRTEVSPHLLEECPVPKRKRFRNDYLRDWAIQTHEALLKCNADKRAIRKELGQ